MSTRKQGKRHRNTKRGRLLPAGDTSDNSDAVSDGGKTQVGSNGPSSPDGSFNGAAAFEQDLDGVALDADVVVDARVALDEALGDLTERKKPTRMGALRSLHKAFLTQIHSEFLMSSHETILSSLSQCLRKGDSTEAHLALATLSAFFVSLASIEVEFNEPKLTEASFASLVPLLERVLATYTNSKVRSMAASVLALGSLVSTTDSTETLRFLDYLSSFWLTDSFTKKFQGNVKVKQKVIPAELSVATLDAWALLTSAVEDRTVIETLFPTAIPQLLRLLAHESLDVRIAAGRVTALMYASIYRAVNGDEDVDLPEVTDDVVEVLSELASDASKSQSKNKRREQRTHFRSFLATVESGEEPEKTVSLKGGRLNFYGWPQLIQLSAIRETLKTGFDQHMHNNLFLIELFNIEEAFDSDQLHEDKSEREYRKRELRDYKKSQRQRKNAFRYHHDE